MDSKLCSLVGRIGPTSDLCAGSLLLRAENGARVRDRGYAFVDTLYLPLTFMARENCEERSRLNLPTTNAHPLIPRHCL